MAAIDWPWDLATIMFGEYGRGADDDVHRSRFDDGFVKQARTVTQSMEIREFQVIVKNSNVEDFRDWLQENANKLFNFQDFEDDTSRECKIRGGYGSVNLVGVNNQRRDGERYMQGTITLESYPGA